MDDKSTQPAGAQRSRPAELVSGCRNRLTKHLLAYVTPVFEHTLESLFASAEKGASVQDQNRLMEAQRVMRNRKTAFTEAFNEQLVLGFTRFQEGTPLPDAEQLPDPEDRADLSLVGERDLEESLAISDMVSKAEIRQTQAIYALNQRLAVLHGGRAVKNNDNPLGPLQIGRALRCCSETLPIDVEYKVRLFRSFDRALQKNIGSCYEEINDYLAQAGILPNIRFEAPKTPRRSPPPEQEGEGTEAESSRQASQEQAKSRASAGVRGAPSRRNTGETDFFGRALGDPSGKTDTAELEATADRLRELLSSTATAPAPAGPPAPAQRLQDALGGLQSRMASLSLEAAGRLGPEQIKRNLREALGTDPETGEPYDLPPREAQTVDIMGMLYEHIEREALLQTPVRSLLQKLQVPLIRAALSEDAFFDDREHPARRFFNTLADTGELWLEDQPEGSATFRKMESAVEQVLKDYQGNDEVFQELLSDLDKHIRLLSRKASLAEKRHVEAARGQEKLELAREQARRLISNLVERYHPPRFVESMLKRPWCDYLALTVLRHGEESEEWQYALKVAKTLIFSVREDLDENVKANLRKRIPALEKALSKGLGQVGYFEADVRALMDNLRACHRWSLAAEAPQTEQPEALHQPVQPLDKQPATAAAPRSAKPRKPDAPELSETEKAMVAKIRLLPFGTWFEFRDEEGDGWHKRKLSWYSPVSGHCLFVNNRGGVAQEMDITALACSMAEGTARVFRPNRRPLIDRAIDAIFGRLRKLAGRETAVESG